MSRRQQVIDLLAVGRWSFDDDEIAERLGMNRHYVNQVCRKLAAEGTVERSFGRDTKYVNRLSDTMFRLRLLIAVRPNVSFCRGAVEMFESAQTSKHSSQISMLAPGSSSRAAPSLARVCTFTNALSLSGVCTATRQNYSTISCFSSTSMPCSPHGACTGWATRPPRLSTSPRWRSRFGPRRCRSTGSGRGGSLT